MFEFIADWFNGRTASLHWNAVMEEKFRALKAELNTTSTCRVIGFALSALETLVHEVAEGGTVVVRRADGSELELGLVFRSKPE